MFGNLFQLVYEKKTYTEIYTERKMYIIAIHHEHYVIEKLFKYFYIFILKSVQSFPGTHNMLWGKLYYLKAELFLIQVVFKFTQALCNWKKSKCL